MLKYFATTVESGDALSVGFMALTRAPDVLAETRGIGSLVTALDDSLWLEFDTQTEINIHPQAVIGNIAEVLQPFIDAGQLPADTNTALAALIESKRGQRLVVYEAFPPIFKDQAKTREQMIDAGLLAKPSVP